jgi:hypothetical protein
MSQRKICEGANGYWVVLCRVGPYFTNPAQVIVEEGDAKAVIEMPLCVE